MIVPVDKVLGLRAGRLTAEMTGDDMTQTDVVRLTGAGRRTTGCS